MPRVSCFLPSYNKGAYVLDAIESVLNQDYEDWELFIIENSTDDMTRDMIQAFLDECAPGDGRIIFDKLDDLESVRGMSYITAWLLNRYYPRASGDIIFYISDDDIFEPSIFGRVVEYFDKHPDREALYFSLARAPVTDPTQGRNFESKKYPPIPATIIRGVDDVDCQIDGGQVAYRKSVLDKIGQPYFAENHQAYMANHVDGRHLKKVAQHTPFYPLPVIGVKHRFTPLSSWTKY